jgi:hypothetical protein
MKIAGRILLAAPLLGLLCLATGCGGGQGYKPAPVSGTVTIDGRPVAGIVVTFQPAAVGGQNPGPGSTGKTDENGRYTLLFATAERKPGAAVGKHRVSFSTWMEEQGDVVRGPSPKELVPPRYRGQSQEFEVKAGGTDKADFALTSK